jgi:hypothetical protein
MKYCPDCGAERRHEEEICPECKFPLNLGVQEHDGIYSTASGQKESWQRIWTLLRKSGLTIQIDRNRNMTQSQAWFAFPAIGLIVLVLSLLFSQPLAKWLLPADVQVVSIDFAKAKPTEVLSGEQSENDISMLKNALKASDEQTTEADDLEEIQEIRFLSEEEILQQVENSVVSITNENKEGYGFFFLEGGYILTTRHLMENAYTRVRDTIKGDRTLSQGMRTITPELYNGTNLLDDPELIHRLDSPPIAILRTDDAPAISFDSDYQNTYSDGTKVWIVIDLSGQLAVESAKIGEVIATEDVEAVRLDTSVKRNTEGLPVFNEAGELVGIQMEIDNMKAMIPLIHIREKAPLVYRDIFNLIQGRISELEH